MKIITAAVASVGGAGVIIAAIVRFCSERIADALSMKYEQSLKKEIQPNFGYAHYSRIMLPLPPLEEQHRIVAKIEELLPLCERLK